MKTIDIDDDIYAYLLKNAEEIGESASKILRRLLGLHNRSETGTAGVNKAGHELSEILSRSEMAYRRPVVDKFLYLLGEVFKERPDDFEKVLDIQGRERIYFAKSREEIESSGQSTQPKKIPGSPYWAMTNTPSTSKKRILSNVLKVLGYSEAARIAATKALGVRRELIL